MAKIRPLSAELQKAAIEELNEDPSRVEADIEALRTWIRQQPHLKPRTDDQFLVGFLRGCKFSLEKAKSKIDKYYALKTKYPNFFTTRGMKEERVLELIRMGVGVSLPRPLNDNGPRLMLIRLGIYPADKVNFDEIMCIAHALQELWILEDDVVMVHGFKDILDSSQLTAGHLLQFTPATMKKLSTFGEEAAPLRQRATYMLHVNSTFEKFFNLMKPLMPPQQQERFHMFGDNLEEFYKLVPKEFLPKEYGGENGSIEEIVERDVQKYLEYREYFKEDVNYGTDEKLRPGKSIDYDNIFGIDGSFRKLNVD